MEQNVKEPANIKTIFSRTLSIFKGNYQLFLRIYLVLGVAQLGSQLFQYYVSKEVEKFLAGGEFSIGFFKSLPMINFFIACVIFAILCRVMVALVIAVKKSYSNEERSYRMCMVESEKLGWNYFGASILYGFMALPAMIPWLIFSFSELMGLKIVMFLLVCAWMLFLHYNYSFGMIITAYKTEEKNYFEYSKKIFKHNRLKYLGINFITLLALLLAMMPSLIPIFITKTAVTSLPLVMLEWLINAVYMMLVSVLTIVSVIEFEKTLPEEYKEEHKEEIELG